MIATLDWASTGTVRCYTESDVSSVLTFPAVIEAIESAVRAEAQGSAHNLSKTMTTWSPSSSAHALGAVDLETKLVAFKTWVNTPAGAAATVTVHDSQDGALCAVVSAGALGALRTAAISAVATRHLAAADADELGIIGAGRQALAQVQAVHVVRPLRRVRVWSRDPVRAAQLARRVDDSLPVETTVAASVADAVRDAPIVTLMTRAAQPILGAADLAPGAHLNAAGAILPANAEFDPQLLARARLTVVDNLENARRASRELREFYGEDWSGVRTLGDVVVSGAGARSHTDPGPTVFKPLGMGLSDLAAVTAFLRVVQPERWANS